MSEDHPTDTPAADGSAAGFRSAEAFLAELGVRRDPIRVEPPAEAAAGDRRGGAGDDRTPVGAREAARLATEAAAPSPVPAASARDATDAKAGEAAGDLGDEVARAVAYARRATAQAPASEAKLRDKLAAREHPPVVIDRALERCRAEGIVDDAAFAAALADERRRKGHAPFRISHDLRRRGFPDDLVAHVVAPLEAQDREAQAFDAARSKVASLAGVQPEAAVRRLVGHLARRGYPEGLARKVAREVVYADRDPRRSAER